MKKIKDVSPYFKKENNQWIFTGKKLEIWIPKVYQERGLLIIGEVATCLAIFQLRINDDLCANMMMLAYVKIEFVSMRQEEEDMTKYLVLELEHNSAFIQNTTLVKNGNLIYTIFVTFLALGKIPPYIDYATIQKLFDKDKDDCGMSLRINHSIFEMIYAHMYRDRKDPYLFYRLTTMTEPPILVPLHTISHGPSSTSARITGSYLNEGVVASLVDETERNPSIVENLLRA